MFKINQSLSGILLVAGTTIGAGMLGIPLYTSASGFLPGVFITFLVWLFMCATGHLFLEATLWMNSGSNLLSITGQILGRSGRLLSGGLFLFLYYSLMIAYFAGGSPIFSQFLGFSRVGGSLAFALIFGLIVYSGLKFIDRLNYVLMSAMFLSYFALVIEGCSEVKGSYLLEMDSFQMIWAIPVLFSSFGFHNVIPSLTDHFDRKIDVLKKSIFGGTALSFLVYVIWQATLLGVVPKDQIASALAIGVPATTALESFSGNQIIVKLGAFFAFFAMVTSLLGVAFSMVDFLKDSILNRTFIGKSRFNLTFIVFSVPLLLSTIDPNIFLIALNIAGGIGEALLNGLLPVVLVWIGRYHLRKQGPVLLPGGKVSLVILFFISIAVVTLEIIQLANR
jgi:tyrosine-specific transport protein